MNTRITSYFFTSADESELSSLVLRRFPDAKFIDVFAWKTSQDIQSARRDLISDCATNCYIWDPNSVPELPSDGKPTHHVAHYSRCRKCDGTDLYLGQTGILVNAEDQDQQQFCNAILRLIRSLDSGPLDVYNYVDDAPTATNITNLIVGPDAYVRSAGDLTLRYGDRYYKPRAKTAG